MINDIDKIRCLEREIAMRKRVYPRWVADKRMKQESADREIRIMESILADYLKVAQLGAVAEVELDRFGNGDRRDP